MEILGSGGYGIVIGKDEEIDNEIKPLALKLFYDINDCNALKYEIKIQEKCKEILDKLNSNLTYLKLNSDLDSDYKYLGVYIPEIYEKYNKVIELDLDFIESKSKSKSGKSEKFLCGVLMDRIKPPKIDGFDENEQIHIGLGLQNVKSLEVNSSWICENKITRGFYANTEMLEIIIDEVKEFKGDEILENYNFPNVNLPNISYTIGKAYSELFKKGIKPFDVELVLDENLRIWMIDFGKVYNFPNVEIESEKIYNSDSNFKDFKESKLKYYNDTSYRGLASDLYVPHKIRNDKYWEDFYEGFFKE